MFLLAGICLINLWDVLENAFSSVAHFVALLCLIFAVLSSIDTKIVHWALGYNASTAFCLICILGCLDNYNRFAYETTYSVNVLGWKFDGVSGLLVQVLPYALLLITTIINLILDVSNLKRILAKIDSTFASSDNPIFHAPSYPIKVNKKSEQD